MSGVMRILLVVVSVMTFLNVVKRIRKSRLQIEQAIFWVLLSIGLVIIAIFPQIMYWLANVVGVQSPINMVFLIIIFILLIKVFFQSLEISQLEYKLQELVQEIAIREHEQEMADKH